MARKPPPPKSEDDEFWESISDPYNARLDLLPAKGAKKPNADEQEGDLED